MSMQESAPLSIEQAVAELGKAPPPVKAEKPQPAPAPEEPEEEIQPEADPDPDNALAEGEDTLEVDEPDAEAEDDPEPIPEPPVSWSKEDREGWAELTPKAREIVLRREADRDKAVSQAVQKASEATKAVQILSEQTNQIAHLATDAFERKWQEKAQGPIQWAALARQMDPAEYQALHAEYEADKIEVDRAAKAAAEQSKLARGAFLTEEWKKLEQIAPELTDPKEGHARREKVASYLIEQGIPGEAVGDASAIEWKIAWKAMRFDMMEAKAKEQSALPRKNPAVAQAKPVRPAAGGDPSPTRTLQAAMTTLSKTGTVDAAVAALQAQREANSKGRRQ